MTPSSNADTRIQLARLEERLSLNIADLTRRIEATQSELASLSRLVYGVALSATAAFGVALLKIVIPGIGGP